jgi:hypothetical protein
MAPTAVCAAVTIPETSEPAGTAVLTQTNEPTGPLLAIGSLTTAQDGKYQALVSNLVASATDKTVERQMLDRLIDGGMSPSSADQ